MFGTGRYDIQIAALSETRFADAGEIKEVGAGYTFFWSGRKSEERREAGVGFAIKTELVGKLSGLPKGINDRLMTLRLPLSGNKHATIVSAYAPTMTNPDEVKDKFYDDLDNVISATPRTDKLILLGDFNARVGTDHQTWEGVIGPEGVGKCNSNGLLLLRKCAEHDLLITITVFRLPNRNKTSWISKYNVGLKTLLNEGLSEPDYYGDLVYKFKKLIGSNDFSFQFRKIITRYRSIGYNLNVMRQSACLVFNPIMVDNYAAFFNCTPVGRASDSMMAPT